MENTEDDLFGILPEVNQDEFSFSSNPLEPNGKNEQSIIPNIPDELPVLPLRGMVVYPQTAVPLTIGQPRSIKLIEDILLSNRMFCLLASKNADIENPEPEDLYDFGTVSLLHRIFRAPDGTIRILVQGISRCQTKQFTQIDPYFKAVICLSPETNDTGLEVDALARNVRDQFEHIAEMVPSIPRELVSSISSLINPLQTVYTIANFQRMHLSDAQSILELDLNTDKLRKLVAILTRESEVLELGQRIQNEARGEIDKMQREFFLREELKAIQRELGEADEQSAEIDDLLLKVKSADLPEEAHKQAHRELARLSKLSTVSPEFSVIRTYLDWILSLPWKRSTEDYLDIQHAREILETDHFGLQDVKQRILEFLAVRKLRLDRRDEWISIPTDDFIRKEREGVVLCFVGPPGVGKTSLGRSIARSMGRKFIRLSLGGIRDEAEIRGHRRTYIGALPGRVLQSLRRIEVNNPVFMLDEIDKLTFDYHGDPASALLEVLDPEQNNEFRDNYLEIAYNLSPVMFITTANQTESIPTPLLDRMEVIHIAGYTDGEKLAIARRYLLPRQIRENGLREDEIRITDGALNLVIRHYTREAGVRNLEREIGNVCRKIVLKINEGKPSISAIDSPQLKSYLGKPKFYSEEEIMKRTAIPGVAIGLAWTPAGGEILFIEATMMPGSKGFIITGSVGSVMYESAQAALSYVRSRTLQYGINPSFFEQSDIHLHIPAGAQPKDGPSAGVTIATALISLLTGKLVHPKLGMSGEITLRGQVLPVGGVKEKVLAAHRAGLLTLILPVENESDLEQIPEEIRNEEKFIFADTMDDVISAALNL
jgi:ATP-dependent Lon protease